MKRLYLTQHRLNLRTSPDIQADNILVILPYDHLVIAERNNPAGWIKVNTQIRELLLTGYVQLQYLAPVPAGCADLPQAG